MLINGKLIGSCIHSECKIRKSKAFPEIFENIYNLFGFHKKHDPEWMIAGKPHILRYSRFLNEILQ